jgi:phosphonate transport system ATP-binding protein
MAAGRVVFDDVPAALTEDAARELYGMEANEVIGNEPAAIRHAAASMPVHA